MKRGLGFYVARELGRLAPYAPGLALHAADLIAMATPRMPYQLVQSIFPHLSNRVAKQVTAHARSNDMRNQVIVRMVSIAGMEPQRRLVEESAQLAALRPPVILGTFHLGAITALGPALERVPGRVLVLRRNPAQKKNDTPLTIEATTDDEQHRALVFHRALDWLGGGNSVFMSLDPEQAVRVQVPFLGRTLQLARGPFAMSRIAQVPIVPVVARWRGARVEIVAGSPIGPAEDEMEVASATAAWLECYLMDSPLEISRRILTLTT